MLTRFFLFIFLSLQSGFHVLTASPVKIKFINKSELAIRVSIDGEEEMFGLGEKPVLYASVDSHEPTLMAFEALDDLAAGARCALERSLSATGTAVSSSSSAATLFKTSNLAAQHAKRLKEELEVLSLLLSRAGSAPTSEFLLAAQSTGLAAKNADKVKLAVESAKSARAILGFGVLSLGVSGVDWLCADGKMASHFLVTPASMPGFQEGHEIVIVLQKNKITAFARPTPEAFPAITCLIETRSKSPLMCVFTDEQGDECHVRLNKEKFNVAVVTLKAQSQFEIKETVPYSRSAKHHGLVLMQGCLNAGLAVCDPFLWTKGLSAMCAAQNLYSGLSGLADRSLTRRKLRCAAPETDSKITTSDCGRYSLISNVEIL